MINIISQLILFAGLIVFGLFIPNVFIFVFLVVVWLLMEWDKKETASQKRHAQLMKALTVIAKKQNKS